MSTRIYPVIHLEESCKDYRVRVNGREVELDTARVSACTLNRRWPGHQRQIQQTELVNFLSMALDEPVEIEVLPLNAFENVIIRPLDSVEPFEVTEEGWIRFRIEKPGFYMVEPFGRHHVLHIFADPVKDYNVKEEEEHVIYFGRGVHEAGTIELHSNETLYIEEGAVVFASVVAKDAENIRILGRGILDNSHNKEEILYEAKEENNLAAVNNAIRTHTIQLEYCSKVEIDGITIRDSLVYNIRPIACSDLKIRDVKIIGCWRYNSDGIDMHNCENVEISGCFIRTFDDCICVKGFDYLLKEEDMWRNGKAFTSFRHVHVKDCTIWNDWNDCLEIGAETRADEICDIIFEDCHIIHVTTSVLDCTNVDYADVHDVTYKNIYVEYDEVVPVPVLQTNDNQVYENPNPDYVPRLICGEILYHFEYSADKERRGKIRDFTYENIHLTGRQKPLIYFKGYDEAHGCRNIVISDLYWNGEKLTEFPEGCLVKGDFCHEIVLK